MEDKILFQYADGTEELVHVDRIDAFKQQYPDAVQVSEISKPREKSVYQRETKKFIPNSKMSGGGTFVIEKGPEVEDNIDEKIYPTTMPDGSTQDLSLLDLADPKINTNLEDAIIAEEKALDNPNLFKPYQQQPDPLDGFDSWTTEGIVYPMIQPYEKELQLNKERLNELSKLGKFEGEEYTWNNDPDNGGTLEVPQDILEKYTRDQLKRGIKDREIGKIWEEALEDMPDDLREANTLARIKMFDDADAENYVDDTEKFMIRQQAFANGEQFKSVFDFENNVLDNEFTFENPNNEKTIEINGKQVPLSLYKKYTTNLPFVQTEQFKLTKEYEDLFKRREAIENVGIELDLLGRDWSMLSKFGFLAMKGAGDLIVGAGEYLEAGANILRDTKMFGIGPVTVPIYMEKEGNEFSTISNYAKKRREKNAKLKEKFRPDQEFGEAFDSLENFVEFFVEESGRQLPIFAAIAASGGAASLATSSRVLQAATSATTLGVMTGGQQIGDITYQDFLQGEAEIMKYGKDLEYNNRDWNDLEKFLIGTGYGAAEGILGTAPTFLLMKRGKDLITASGMKGLLNKKTRDMFLKDLPKEIGIGVALEAPTEGLTQLFQNGLMISMGDKNVDLFDGVGHATFAGGMFGGLLGGGSVAMGMAMNKMMPQKEKIELQKQFDLLDELKTKLHETKYYDAGSQRKNQLEFLNDKISVVENNINNKLNDFNSRVQQRLGNGAIYNEFIALKRGQADFRAEANRIYNDSNLTGDAKKTLIDDLAFKYQLYENAINGYLGKTDPNRFIALAENDKERYDKILKQAENDLIKEGKKTTDQAVQEKAYDIYLREEVDANINKTQEMLKETSMNTENFIFENENQAKIAASIALADPNITQEEKTFWENLLKADGGMNGFAMRVNDKYTWVNIKDSMVENERTNTATHEADHIVMWNALLKGQDFDWQKMADEIELFLKETNPEVYNTMFGISPSQSVEKGKDNKPKAEEVVINFMERINDIDLSTLGGKRFMHWFGGEVNNVTGGDINWKNNNDIILFISQLAKKIANGDLTKNDIELLRKSELLNKYKIDKADVEQTGKSESTLFEKTEELGANWSNLSEDEKINKAQQIGLYWENFLNKKIKQQISVDETEQFALLNKFLGLDTDPAQIKNSFGYKRGFIDIVKRWDPAKNNSLAAWIQSANNLPMRILELAQGSKRFGRFESSIDEQREGSRPIDIKVEENVEFDQVKDQVNEVRKLLNIENNSKLYNKTLDDVTKKLTDVELKNLVKENPKKLRQNLKKSFEKALAKEISNIIGTQKSQKFKDFISNKENLQKIVDLLGVKYRNRFPMFTNDGGRANVAQSKIIQESDQGSFISDTKAGNQIWIPKDVNKMSEQEIQDIANDFIQGRETKYKSLKNALATELGLDAVFTALEQSPNLQNQYDGLTGKLAESIKRSPEAAFSMSKQQQGDLLNEYLKVAKNGTNKAEYMRDEFEDNGLLHLYDRAKSYIEDNGIDGPNGFIQTVTSKNLPEKIGETIRQKEIKWIRDGDFKQFEQYQKDILKLAGVLDPKVLKVFGIDFMGIHYRHLNPKKFRAFINELEGVASQEVANDKFADLLENIEDVIKVVDSGKLGSILKSINEAESVNDKMQILLTNYEVLQAANEANTNLRNYIALKINEAKLSNETIYLMLQSQTNIINGFRALSTIEHFRIVDGIQSASKNKKAKSYYDKWSKVVGYDQALKENKGDRDKAITDLKTKNEHLGANSATMGDLAVALFYNQIKTVEDANNIFKDHITLFSTNKVLNGIDDAGGRVNQAAEFRVNMFMTPDEASNHYHISGVNSAEYIIDKKAKEILSNNINKTSTTRKNLQQANSKSVAKKKGISVFDFDDTLARTKSKILVTLDNKKFKIDATEFALQSADLEAAGAKFDFSEFNKVVEGEKGPLADLALKRAGKFGTGDIFVLTARPQEAAYAIHAFLKGIGLNIPIDNITGLEDGRPEAKADWIINKVSEGYNDFYFADDAIKNIKAVSDILKDVDVKSRVELAFSKSDNKFEEKINQIIENQSGVRKETKYSEVVAKRRGADIGKYEMFMPASAEDFVGLLTYLTGKGEQGSKDRQWLIDNLAKPYFKGVDAINIAKTMIKTDYNKLLKGYKNIDKILNDLIPNGNFTYDQAIRIYIWNKQGQQIPGLSKRDIIDATRAVIKNENIKGFADGVEKIGSVDNLYIKPEEGWDVGTILGDLNNLSNKVGRKAYLKDWLNIIESTLTPDVMSKLEAVYGTRYIEALKDILYRMTNGTNRTVGQNRQVNAWLNWVNNSVGTIMFFNRKSALLQSISTINFLNWSDNNPMKAAMAYANQPQFWKDFVYIWNSPKLKQRRRGLQTDLQWQEIASAAKRGKGNKVNAVISYLLKIGFTPTQLVDNFAIAAGGAPFYRNRLNTYLKKGMSQTEAEAKAWEDFSNVAEETQQSGDPALISQEQASVLGRFILNFQNTPMQMVRLQKKAGIMIVRRQRYPGMSQMQSDFTNMGKIIYYGMIQNFIFTFLQNAMFALLPGFEGEEFDDMEKQGKHEEAKQAKMINNMIDTLLRGSGIKGAVLSTLKNAILRYQKEEAKGFTADHTYTLLELANVSPSVGSKFRKVYNAMQTKKFNKDVLEERGFSVMADGRLNLSPAYDMVGNLVSAAFNLPMDRVIAEVDALVEATDSRNANWQRIALALGWRTWDVGAKNEEEDLIKAEGKERRKIQGIQKGKETRAKTKQAQTDFYMNILPYMDKDFQNEFWMMSKADRNKYIKEYKK